MGRQGFRDHFRLQNKERERHLSVGGSSQSPRDGLAAPAHNGNANTQAFDPAVFAGLYGVPEDAEALRASWPVKWSETVAYQGPVFPPSHIVTVPAVVYGLLNVNLERTLEELGYTPDQIRSTRHPVTRERFTNAPSGYLGQYNQGATPGDFFTRFITFAYLFDLDVLNAPPHEDPVVEDLRKRRARRFRRRL